MSALRLLPAALLALVLVSGCDASVRVDPEGYRCDVGNACPSGYACKDGFCRASVAIDPSCDGITCNQPPAATCSNATTLRTFAGRCVSGACQYDPVDTTCSQGCADGACVDPCATVSCVTPPQTACADATTLRTFAQTGTCNAGTCIYAPTDTTCPNGCSNARCQGVDLCVNVTCNMAPAATCIGNTRRTFAMTGTCDSGTGVCTYAPTDTACANGCALGQCLTASLTYAQTGPRVRFAVNGIDVAPGSSGNSALAVGNAGKIARWDGSTWTELNSMTTNALRSVAFVTSGTAYAVGAARTALLLRPGASSGQVSAVALSGSGSANFVAVSGRSENEVLIASDTGDWWRRASGNWTNGSLPSANAPYTITAAYLDESLRDRLVGSCGSGTTTQCVGYRNPTGGTPTFQVHTQTGTQPFTAVGGSFDVPASTGSEALLGNSDSSLDTHSNLGNFGSVSPSPALDGAGIVGITAQAVAIGRDVFVLTSSKAPSSSTFGQGGLYRLSKTLTSVSSAEVLQTYFGEEKLSPNDANGVLVAEVRRAQGINNIFRRGTITNEALDVAEDFVGASVDDQGALVLVSQYGDVVVRRPTSATFDFRRPPMDWSIEGFEAKNGTGILMVGADSNGTDGVIVRVTAGGFNTVATKMGQVFKAVCRVSDTEGWAVGEGGTIYRVTGTSATQVTSPTTEDLFTVDCAAGVGVAAGANGTVLRLASGTWTAVTPAFPLTRTITTARLVMGGAFVGGDSFFYRFTAAPAGWQQLASKGGLASFVVRGPQEIYGAFVNGSLTDVARFDGAAWGPSLVQVTGVLGGGVQAGGRVVWGGTLGAIVEGR